MRRLAWTILLAGCNELIGIGPPGLESDGGVVDPADAVPFDAMPDAAPDADVSPTVAGTLAVLDTQLTDPSIALSPLFAVRGGSVQLSFDDLTDPSRGGMVVFEGSAGAPIGSCLVTRFDATHLPHQRLDAGTITVSGSALRKTIGPCTFQASTGEYRCVSHQALGTATVLAQTVGSPPASVGGVVAYVFSAPIVDLGMTTPIAIVGAVRGPSGAVPADTVQITTAAPHGFVTGQFAVITGSGTFNSAGALVEATSATTFRYPQVGALEVGGTLGAASGARNLITGSSLVINGFTAGSAAALFNSGTGSFPIVAQVNANTVLAYNAAAIGLAGGTGSQGLGASYTIQNARAPVVTGPTFVGFHDFLSASTLRIQKAGSAVWSAFDVTADVPGEAPPAAAITSLLRAGGVVTATLPTGHGITVGQRITIAGSAPSTGAITSAQRTNNVVVVTMSAAHDLTAGSEVVIGGVAPASFNGTFEVLASPAPTATTFAVFDAATDDTGSGGTASLASYDGTFTVTAATATTFGYAQAGNDATASAPGTAQKSSFALDAASQPLHVFPTTAIDLRYGCDNATPADLTDDTCGDASTSTLKAMILTGRATRRRVTGATPTTPGLAPWEMPDEVAGSSTAWLEWQCIYLLSRRADLPSAAVQAILDFQPTRVEQTVQFVAGSVLDDGGVNVAGLRVLTGHALSGHQTFCPAAGPGIDAFGQTVCP